MVDISQLVKPDPRARPRPYTFRPPKENALCLALARIVVPVETRRKLKVTEIVVDDADLDRLRALKGERCILTPSHSGGFEPYIIMRLGQWIQEHYNFIAAAEVFEKSPITGWFLQRMGVYSIIRGTADRPSFKMTKRLLVEAKRWLVIFPEGQTVWQNDTVMPFQQGVFQLAFGALEEAEKATPGARLRCVPIAIKYVYLDDMTSAIDAALTRLESKLFTGERLDPLPAYDRLRRVGLAVLEANEKKYRIVQPDGAEFDTRIQLMKEKIVSRLEQQLEVTPRAAEALLDRVRALFNAVDRIVFEEEATTEYGRELQQERRNESRLLYEDLWRVLQLIAIYDGYVRESLTVERFLDMIGLLEMEVLKQRTLRGPRKALIKVGEPIDLADRLPAYRENRKSTVRGVSLALETSVREMLDSMSDECHRVEVPSAG